MLTVRLDEGEGVVIGDNPDSGAAVKVLARSGRRVHLSILTNLRVSRQVFGLHPPVFAPGLAGVSVPRPDVRDAMSCATV